MGNLPAKILHGGARETSPPAFAAPCLRLISRSLFVFCFQRDPRGLYSLPFQKAKVLLGLSTRQRNAIGKTVTGTISVIAANS
jgi:hypothetical protein